MLVFRTRFSRVTFTYDAFTERFVDPDIEDCLQELLQPLRISAPTMRKRLYGLQLPTQAPADDDDFVLRRPGT